MRAQEFITEAESYQPPSIAVGDEVRVGKFKNRKAEVRGFATDKNNQPVLKTDKGDQQLFKPRIAKLMAEEELTELFDTKTSFPLEWDTQFAHHGEVHAHAQDSQGREIHISFVPTELRLTPDSKYATEVAFSRGGNYEVTGKGDASKVLGTVVNEIFLQKYKPDSVVFSAKEGSRASLYASMIKRIARGYKLLTPAEYPDNVHTYLDSVGSDAPFILARV